MAEHDKLAPSKVMFERIFNHYCPATAPESERVVLRQMLEQTYLRGFIDCSRQMEGRARQLHSFTTTGVDEMFAMGGETVWRE